MCKQKDTYKQRHLNPCPQCKGKAYVTVYRHNSIKPVRITCPSCLGSGCAK